MRTTLFFRCFEFLCIYLMSIISEPINRILIFRWLEPARVFCRLSAFVSILNCLFMHFKQCTLLINTINPFVLMNVNSPTRMNEANTHTHSAHFRTFTYEQISAICANNYWGHSFPFLINRTESAFELIEVNENMTCFLRWCIARCLCVFFQQHFNLI